MALFHIIPRAGVRTSCRNLFGANSVSLGREMVHYLYNGRPNLVSRISVVRIDHKLNQDTVSQTLCHRRYMGKLAASLVQSAPGQIQPYLKLLRLDKPIGSWLLFWPCAWSIGLAASPGALPNLYALSLVGAGAIIMRGAGCIINDLWDRDLDVKVERTKDRPLASGAISPGSAVLFLGGTLMSGLLVLVQFDWYCIVLGASSLCLVTTYPLAKRIFNWPQLGLGLVFNWGALFGWAAVKGVCDFSVCLPLYLGCISWTLVYDTVYAFQDKRDDAKIGIKSTALTWNKKSKSYLIGFTGLMTAALFSTGVICDQTYPYYTLVGASTTWLAYQCAILDTDNPTECNKLFVLNSLLGAVIMAGIVLGTLKKKPKDEKMILEE